MKLLINKINVLIVIMINYKDIAKNKLSRWISDIVYDKVCATKLYYCHYYEFNSDVTVYYDSDKHNFYIITTNEERLEYNNHIFISFTATQCIGRLLFLEKGCGYLIPDHVKDGLCYYISNMEMWKYD